MSNEIILRSVYGKVNQTYFIQPCPNPKTGKLPPCVKTIDSNGDMILSEDEIKQMNSGQVHYVPANHVFQIVDGTYFNLDDVVDKANWEAIEYCNWIAKDRYQRDDHGDLIIDGNAKRYGVADLYVERPGEIATVRVSKKKLINRAENYIYDDTEQGRIKKCKVLGRNLSNAISADILDYLLEIAEKTPKKIIDLYEGEDWKMHLFIMDALDLGVIKKKDNIYNYDDKMLGGSIEAVISLFKDVRYKKIVDSIKRETYPQLMTKTELDQASATLTDGIPHFDSTKMNNGGSVEETKPNKPNTKK